MKNNCKQKIKIINVIQNFDSGGRQKLLFEYLKYFNDSSEIDYSVVVLEKRTNSIFEKMADSENLKIKYLNCKYGTNKHYYIRKFQTWWNYNHKLYKYLKGEKPNIVHTHNTRLLTRIKSCIKKTCKKYVWYHSMCSDPYAVADCHVPIAEYVFKRCNVIPICINKTQFEKAKERYKIKTCVFLENAFNQKRFLTNVKEPNTIKKELELDDSKLLIGCIGRVDPVKNYSFFIDVIKEIKKKQSNISAIIVGDATHSDVIKSKIKELNLEKDVKLIGVRKDIQNIYNCLDRFVSTSITEAFSFSTVEAQLFDKFCIVSKAIPIESVCLKNRVVRLDLNDDIQLWAEQILKPTIFSTPGSSLEDFSIDTVANKMLNIYKTNLN